MARAFSMAAVAAGVAFWSAASPSAWNDCRVSWSYDGYTLHTLGELNEVWREDREQYFAVDWGDGSSDYTEANLMIGTAYLAQSHRYGGIGTFTVHFQIGDQSGMCFDFSQDVFIPNQ